MELVAIPCPVCGTSYPSRISVKNHIKVRHPSRDLEVEMQRMIAKYPLLFSTPTSSSPSPTSLRRGRRYNCDKCSKTFLNFSGFRIHFKSQCVVDGEQRKSVILLQKSSQMKTNQIMKRVKSMKSSEDSNDIPEPMCDIQLDKYDLTCYEDLTEKDFEDITILESTISSQDYEDLSILESSQSSNESSKMELDMNLNESKCDNYITTDNADLKCQRCDNGFVFHSTTNLERHVEGVHKLSLGDKFKCIKCARSFKYFVNLSKHDCHDFSSKIRKNNCLRCSRFRSKNQMYCKKCLEIL